MTTLLATLLAFTEVPAQQKVTTTKVAHASLLTMDVDVLGSKEVLPESDRRSRCGVRRFET